MTLKSSTILRALMDRWRFLICYFDPQDKLLSIACQPVYINIID